MRAAVALLGDDRVFADGDAGDEAGRDFELRGGNHFVSAIDAGNRSAHQLRGAQPGDDDKLERVRTVRTLNHETCFFLAALVRLKAGIAARAQESGGAPIIPRTHSLKRYFSRTHSATTPSRQVIFLPSS
ncbi:MAG: hypothetical protein JWL71_1117 [Acidobacteria bacterium]|nr:hypothetical protein [Acidobacteriota bacterium]